MKFELKATVHHVVTQNKNVAIMNYSCNLEIYKDGNVMIILMTSYKLQNGALRLD